MAPWPCSRPLSQQFSSGYPIFPSFRLEHPRAVCAEFPSFFTELLITGLVLLPPRLFLLVEPRLLSHHTEHGGSTHGWYDVGRKDGGIPGRREGGMVYRAGIHLYTTPGGYTGTSLLLLVYTGTSLLLLVYTGLYASLGVLTEPICLPWCLNCAIPPYCTPCIHRSPPYCTPCIHRSLPTTRR